MKLPLSLIIHFLLVCSAYAEDCKFQSAPRILEESHAPRVYLSMWEEPSTAVAKSLKLPLSRRWRDYRNSVTQRLAPEPIYLLRRYIERATRPEDAFNINVILNGMAGKIREVRCLEALLLDVQIQRTPAMETAPTEFVSYFLEREGRLRVYFATNDSEGVSRMGRLMDEMNKDLHAGWRVTGNLHNHSFFLADLENDKPQGVLAPSGNDMRVLNGNAASIGLPRALITNGFNTLVVGSEDFPVFQITE